MNSFQWEPYFPVVPVVVGLLVFLGCLVVVERRKRQRLLWVRLTCLAIMTICVAGLILNPLIVTEQNAQQLLLLTEGYDPDTADSLLSATPDLRVYRTPTAAPFDGAAVATDDELVSRQAEVAFIVGSGLPRFLINQFAGSNYRFLPSGKKMGFVGLQQGEKFYANRWNHINGTYRAGETENYLRLKGPAGVEDSVKVGGIETSFSLAFYPATAGRFTYYLDDGVVREPMFLEILPEQKLNVLLLNTFPTFEQRYLKNILATRGHAIAVKSIVSRGKSRVEFANQAPFGLDNLTSETLQKIDLVIMDGVAYKALSAGEQRTIQKSIEQGLGVLFLPDGNEGKKVTSLVAWKSLRAADTVRIDIERVGKVTLPAIAAEPMDAGEVILKGDGDRVLAGYNSLGAGKVGYTALHETYQLGLQEKKEAYSGLWMPLLERIAREASQEHELVITSPFPWFEDEPVDFNIISSASEPPALTVDSVRVPIREDAHLGQLWVGTMWLDNSKWHTVRIGNELSKLHLAPTGSWKALRIENQINATVQMRTDVDVVPRQNETRSAGAFPVAFLVLFVLAAGMLWLAPKV